jgi:hypothetical protein
MMDDPERTVVWRRQDNGTVETPVTPGSPGHVVEPVRPEQVNVNAPTSRDRYGAPVVAPSPMRVAVWRAQRVIYYIFGIIEAIIAIRFVLKLIAANPTNPFTQGVYGVSWVFDFPFSGIVANLNIGAGATIEFFSLIAILVYALASMALAKLLDLLV